jgi:hypothetical protein
MKKTILQHKKIKLFTTIIFFFFFQNLIAQCNVSINPSNTIICNGGSSTLVASGGGDSWVWSPSTGLNVTTGATVLASPPSTTTYSVTRTCEDGSTSTASVTISVISLAVNAGADILVCTGNTINLISTISGNAGNSVSYSWTGPNGFTSTSVSPTITNSTASMSGNYTVTATVGGCQTQDVVNVQVTNVSLAVNAGANILVCSGSTINLTTTISGNAGNSVSYSWTGPNGFNSNSASPTITNSTASMSGNYTVTATVGGCQTQDIVNVQVADVSITSGQFVGSQLVYCLETGDLFGGVLINLSIPSYSSSITNYSIDWDNNGSADAFYDINSWTNSIFQNFPIGVSQFSITMNLANGCSVVKTYSVFVGSSPSPATLSLFINQATGCVPHTTNWSK